MHDYLSLPFCKLPSRDSFCSRLLSNTKDTRSCLFPSPLLSSFLLSSPLLSSSLLVSPLLSSPILSSLLLSSQQKNTVRWRVKSLTSYFTIPRLIRTQCARNIFDGFSWHSSSRAVLESFGASVCSVEPICSQQYELHDITQYWNLGYWAFDAGEVNWWYFVDKST